MRYFWHQFQFLGFSLTIGFLSITDKERVNYGSVKERKVRNRGKGIISCFREQGMARRYRIAITFYGIILQ